MLPMCVQPPRRDNHDVPKVSNWPGIPETEISLDLCDSRDDPKVDDAVPSTNNACDVGTDNDSSTTPWWISPENDEGCNSLRSSEHQES